MTDFWKNIPPEGTSDGCPHRNSCRYHHLYDNGLYLAVNPGILSAAGMDAGAVFTATALGACLGTLLMALFSNYPLLLLRVWA